MSKAQLLVEEAYYWNYSQHLDLSYLDHPPMVALLIKLFTSILGLNEFSVRFASLFCWSITTFFSYKLSELITPSSGRYSIVLMAVLPFFFIQSIIITPDVPLLSCWSAALYYLYRALVLNEKNSWYKASIALGLGMLSKYTICLLSLAILVYMLSTPNARTWFKRKEPYLGALVAVMLFSPVIYWNFEHHWISFIFQSSRRFASTTSFNSHTLLWITLFFITPLGVISLYQLGQRNSPDVQISYYNKKFIRCFTLTPLCFFILYSLNHEVNFNWIGPVFLALLPWIATVNTFVAHRGRWWTQTAFCLLTIYGCLFLLIAQNKSSYVQQKLLLKIIAWDDLTTKLVDIAHLNERERGKQTLFVPLDNYPISSELSFYQTKLLNEHRIQHAYPIIGAHIFDRESLMYRYWSSKKDISGKILILIAKEQWRFSDPAVTSRIEPISKLSSIQSLGQGQHLGNIPYYYQLVRIKNRTYAKPQSLR
jgi:dolichol-phosphate mannosyltransferase